VLGEKAWKVDLPRSDTPRPGARSWDEATSIEPVGQPRPRREPRRPRSWSCRRSPPGNDVRGVARDMPFARGRSGEAAARLRSATQVSFGRAARECSAFVTRGRHAATREASAASAVRAKGPMHSGSPAAAIAPARSRGVFRPRSALSHASAAPPWRSLANPTRHKELRFCLPGEEWVRYAYAIY
jgi:hypothetical protein